jgi:hypothetical protein
MVFVLVNVCYLVPFVLPLHTTYQDEKDSVPKRRHIKFIRRVNHQKERIKHSQNGERLKSRIYRRVIYSAIHRILHLFYK